MVGEGLQAEEEGEGEGDTVNQSVSQPVFQLVILIWSVWTGSIPARLHSLQSGTKIRKLLKQTKLHRVFVCMCVCVSVCVCVHCNTLLCGLTTADMYISGVSPLPA